MGTRLVIFAFVLVLTSCGKKAAPPAADTTPPASAAAEPAPPAATASPTAQSAPLPSPVPAAPAQGQRPVPVVGTVDPFMTQQLRIFINTKGRLPKDFSEFTSARMDSVPRPPKGLKWVLDTANQEIKLAPQ